MTVHKPANGQLNWGEPLNAALDELDAAAQSAQNTANAISGLANDALAAAATAEADAQAANALAASTAASLSGKLSTVDLDAEASALFDTASQLRDAVDDRVSTGTVSDASVADRVTNGAATGAAVDARVSSSLASLTTDDIPDTSDNQYLSDTDASKLDSLRRTGWQTLSVDTTVDSGYTYDHYAVDASGGARAITLYQDVTAGVTHYIQKVDASANAVTVTPSSVGGAGTINGGANVVLSKKDDWVEVQNTALNTWRVLRSNLPIYGSLATALSGKEPTITAGSTAQYLRGDKSLATLNQDAVPDGTTNKAYTATEKTKLAAITGTNTGDQTTITGNAATATKLATARNINGVAFDGTANITVADATKAPLPTTGAHPLTGMYHADGYGTLDKTGVTDATATLNTWLAALPNYSTAYLPPGTYKANTVTSGVILSLTGKTGITIIGPNAEIVCSSGTATELFRVNDCPQFDMEGVSLRVTGTAAFITHGLHITASSPGSAEAVTLRSVQVTCDNFSNRSIWEGTSQAGDNKLYSGSAAFTAADIGGTITGPSQGAYYSTITAVATLSNTLSGAINASVTSIPLTGAISGAPTPNYYVVKIDSELILVQTGGTTSTLGTCIRGYAGTTAASHSSGATVSLTRATLTANFGASGEAYGAATFRIKSPSQSSLLNGISIAADHPGASNVDVSEVALVKCVIRNCDQAGLLLGNGTSGNVLNMSATDCLSQLNGYGVFMNGGAIAWKGGSVSNNTVDFQRGAGNSQPIHVTGVRSENSGRFWESGGSGSAGQAVLFEACEVSACHAPDYRVLQHMSGGMLTLVSMRILNFTAPYSAQIALSGSSGNPTILTAINVATTNADNPFAGPTYPPGVIRNIIGGTILDTTTGAVKPSPFGNISDVGARIYEGANGNANVATLVAGTVTVTHTGVTANSRIRASVQSLGTVTRPQSVGVSARVVGTSFTLKSTDATDTSVVYWELSEPAS